MKKLKVIVIGAGGRGRLYAKIMAASPEKYEVIAVADPIKERRDFVADSVGIGEDMRFENWDENSKIIDSAFNRMTDDDSNQQAATQEAINNPVMASGIVNITQATQEDFLSRRGEDVL